MNNDNIQNNIEEDILNKIEGVEPKPKWEFLLKNTYFWILGGATIIMGSLFVSASIFVFSNIGWAQRQITHESILGFVFESLPFMWIILVVVFVSFTHFLIRKTKHGYKHHIAIIISVVLLSSFALGIAFAAIGMGEILDDDFGEKIPFHKGVKSRSVTIWEDPANGLLGGKVIETEEGVKLFNEKGEVWNLILDGKDYEDIEFGKVERFIGFLKEDSFYVCGVLSNERPKLFERKPEIERSKECEAVKPYQRLLKTNSIANGSK
ncbi:MAG: hypothetical protein ACI9GH_000331 [Candidatus Paceibacteria bacterium]|jgi:hypothetical protein